MKRMLAIFLLMVFTAGCATYKFQSGKAPFDQGYVVARKNYVIPEYTVGQNNSVPKDINIAKQRFKRRKDMVEHYYKKMGYIDNGFKSKVLDPAFMVGEFIVGVFHWPFIAVSDYRYNHNPNYHQKMDNLDQEREDRALERVRGLKGALNEYVQKDLAREGLTVQAPSLSIQPQAPVVKEAVATKEIEKVEQKVQIKEIEHEMIQQKAIPAPVRAAIIAKPVKGFSPLTVHFYGNKSHSAAGKIIFYSWDFGDGDTSTKADPVNTYYSGSLEPRQFTAALIVRDDKGNSSTSTIIIEVLNK